MQSIRPRILRIALQDGFEQLGIQDLTTIDLATSLQEVRYFHDSIGRLEHPHASKRNAALEEAIILSTSSEQRVVCHIEYFIDATDDIVDYINARPTIL